MADMGNPGALAGAAGASGKASRAAGFLSIAQNKVKRERRDGARIVFEAADGPHVEWVKGRELWALRALIAAGPRGVTPIEHVGPRWSDYVFKLRTRGIVIETIREEHGGDFPGFHGRYVLRTPIALAGGAA